MLLFINLHLNSRQKRHLATRSTHLSPSKRFPTKTSPQSSVLQSTPGYPVLTGGAMGPSPGSSRRSALEKEYTKSYEPIAKNRFDMPWFIWFWGHTNEKSVKQNTQPGRAPQKSTTARTYHVVVGSRERTLHCPRHLTTSFPTKERESDAPSFSFWTRYNAARQPSHSEVRNQSDVSPHTSPHLSRQSHHTRSLTSACRVWGDSGQNMSDNEYNACRLAYIFSAFREYFKS